MHADIANTQLLIWVPTNSNGYGVIAHIIQRLKLLSKNERKYPLLNSVSL